VVLCLVVSMTVNVSGVTSPWCQCSNDKGCRKRVFRYSRVMEEISLSGVRAGDT
jgi:hypothetical protein